MRGRTKTKTEPVGKDFIAHPRAGEAYRATMDYATCVVVGALVRQQASLIEAINALRHAPRVPPAPGDLPSDDPVNVPHLEEFTVRLYGELVETATRLELAYRHVQRALRRSAQEASDRATVSRETDDYLEVPGEDPGPVGP